jgi:flagellar protein FliJ
MPGRTRVQAPLRYRPHRPTTRNVDETPFRFGLERVRELREHDEDRAREDFAASLTRRERDAAMLRAASDLVMRAQDARRAGAPLDGQTIVAQQLWLERVETDRRKAELEVTRRDAEIESRRQALAAAQQRREVLERLKDRHRAEHQAADAQRAAAALDEMALAIHRRREQL